MAAPDLVSAEAYTKLPIITADHRITYGDDFVYDLTAKGVSFVYSVKSRSTVTPEKRVTGNRFGNDIKEVIRALRSGDKLYVEAIKAKGSDNVVHNLGGITLTVQ